LDREASPPFTGGRRVRSDRLSNRPVERRRQTASRTSRTAPAPDGVQDDGEEGDGVRTTEKRGTVFEDSKSSLHLVLVNGEGTEKGRRRDGEEGDGVRRFEVVFTFGSREHWITCHYCVVLCKVSLGRGLGIVNATSNLRTPSPSFSVPLFCRGAGWADRRLHRMADPLLRQAG
jgi:hypothetical protein